MMGGVGSNTAGVEERFSDLRLALRAMFKRVRHARCRSVPEMVADTGFPIEWSVGIRPVIDGNEVEVVLGDAHTVEPVLDA
jgi:hypothetical protein